MKQFNCEICGHFGNGEFSKGSQADEADAWLCERCGAVVELVMTEPDYDAQAKDDKLDFGGES